MPFPAPRSRLATVCAAAFGIACPATAQLQVVHEAVAGPATGAARYAAAEGVFGVGGGRSVALTNAGVLSTDGTTAGTALVREVPELPHYGYAVDPEGIMPRATDVLFLACGTARTELWRTDGTAGGTALVKRLAAPAVRWPQPLQRPAAVLGAIGLFLLDTPASGAELWRTDGTDAGTFLVRDIAPGPASSHPEWLTVVGNEVFFAADDGTNGRELWKSDGTPGGTVLVRDISVGANGSSPQWLATWNGTLFCQADDGIHGTEPWRSDGSLSGTTLVLDIWPGAAGSNARDLADGGAFLCFSASTAAFGYEPWRSDGTAGGTSQIADLVAGSGSSWPANFLSHGGRAYFHSSYNGVAYATDGTAAGTLTLTPAGLGVDGADAFASLGAFTYFLARDGTNASFLYRTSGTPSTTSLVSTLPEGTARLRASSGLLFSAPDLWRSDGTANGTFALTTEGASSLTTPILQLPHGPVVFGAATLPPLRSLWVSDGTFLGTHGSVVLNGGTPFGLAAAVLPDGASVATAAIDDSGLAVYRFDASPGAGQIASGIGWLGGELPTGFTRLRSTTLYFHDDPGAGIGTELWRTNGLNGPTLVRDIRPGGLGSILPRGVLSKDPPYPAVLGDRAIFFADDGVHGREPWITDGTTAGTVLLADLNPGAAHGMEFTPTLWTPPIVVVGDRAYFPATDGVHGVELWSTDGTTAGTTLVRDIEPGTADSWAEPRAALGGRLLLTARTAAAGDELWISDGSAAGTALLRDVNPGPADSFLLSFAAGTNLCWFTGHEDGFGHELWRTDGTTAGTFRVVDSDPGPASGNGRPMHVLADRDVVLFRTCSPAHGTELWVSDGTPNGTWLAQELQPGPVGSFDGVGHTWDHGLALIRERVVLPAWTEATGRELFGANLQALLIDLGYSFPVGAGCAGTHGIPALRATQPPFYSNAQFGVELKTGLAAVLTVFGASLAESHFLFGSGCWLHLLPPIATVFAVTDAAGNARWSMPLPNHPSFVGVNLLLQGGVLDPQGAFQGIAVSRALRVVIGNH